MSAKHIYASSHTCFEEQQKELNKWCWLVSQDFWSGPQGGLRLAMGVEQEEDSWQVIDTTQVWPNNGHNVTEAGPGEITIIRVMYRCTYSLKEMGNGENKSCAC